MLQVVVYSSSSEFCSEVDGSLGFEVLVLEETKAAPKGAPGVRLGRAKSEGRILRRKVAVCLAPVIFIVKNGTQTR